MYEAELSTTSQVHPQNHIHKIKGRYGFSMKTQYIPPLLWTPAVSTPDSQYTEY